MAWGIGHSDGRDKLVKVGVNSDVVRTETECYEQWKRMPETMIDPALYSCRTVDEKCYELFNYLVQNVTYKEDPDGGQWIKSPARLLKDGVGDCKSLTMFLSCCLNCLGIPHIIRFVNFDGQGQYTHVYPVAIDERGKEIILDACETDEYGRPIYDYARAWKQKLDFKYDC